MHRLALLIMLLTGATFSPAAQIYPRATTDRPDDRPGPQVHIVYAVPSDGVDNGLDTDGTLVDSVAVWEQWFVQQTGDSVLRLDTYQGHADVTFLRLPFTAQQISAAAPNELSKFRSALGSVGLNDPNKEYGIYYDGASGLVPSCGRGGSLLGVVYLHPTATVNCAPVPFRHPGESAEYREFIMVHELLHGLGMVPTCAPHWTNDNHVSETQDVMTGGTIGNNQQLDVGRDDYFRAHIPGCVDLANSTYMAAPPPGAPGNAAATAGDHAATVSFSAASGTVTSYIVTSSPGGVAATGTSSPITVPGLANGVTYTFTVAAFNGTEPGAASAPSNAIVPNTPPGPPTGVTAFAGDGTATVFFSPPASAGDSAIESYTVAASPGGKTVVGSHSPITVTGLEDGTEYTFTVRATNALATGPPSAPSNAVVPGKPERVHLEPPLPSPRPDVPDVVIPPGGPRRPPPLH